MMETGTARPAMASECRAIFPALDSSTFIPLLYRPGNLGTWSGHLPFARDLVASLRPGTIVELGTHYGESYFAFCQSVQETGSPCVCYAVDTWRGDPHSGVYGNEVYEEVERYNRERYRSFSHLLRAAFDDALSRFSNQSIDLLHIDGLHTYAAVRHDWENWFPKVSEGGIVLFHDVAVRHADFGVWKLWEEVSRQYESFEFHHAYGLGVLRKPGPLKANRGILEYLFVAENAEPIRRYYILCADRLDTKAHLKLARQHGDETLFQVYYPQGGVYSEGASLSTALPAGPWQKLTFDLLSGIEGTALRLDPANRPATIDIGSVALFNAFDHKELWRSCLRAGGNCRVQGTAFAVPAEDYLEVFSYGADPQVEISIPEILPRREPVILECWIRLHEDWSQVAAQIQKKAETAQPGIPISHDSDLSILPKRKGLSLAAAKRWSNFLRSSERKAQSQT